MIIVFTLCLLIIDIVSKIIVINNLDLMIKVKIIDKFFGLTYVRNTGAAWSLFENRTYMLTIISAIIIMGFIYYIVKQNSKTTMMKLSYSLILGGAMGNFVDRVVYGYVIDFFDFNFFGWNFPIFNLADTFIVIGIGFLIIMTWRNRK